MELERSAARAQARGGLGAAAAFLGRGRRRCHPTLPAAPRGCWRRPAPSAMPVRSTPRSRLLGAVDAEALDELGRARVEMLHGQIAFDQRRAGEAAR